MSNTVAHGRNNDHPNQASPGGQAARALLKPAATPDSQRSSIMSHRSNGGLPRWVAHCAWAAGLLVVFAGVGTHGANAQMMEEEEPTPITLVTNNVDDLVTTELAIWGSVPRLAQSFTAGGNAGGYRIDSIVLDFAQTNCAARPAGFDFIVEIAESVSAGPPQPSFIAGSADANVLHRWTIATTINEETTLPTTYDVDGTDGATYTTPKGADSTTLSPGATYFVVAKAANVQGSQSINCADWRTHSSSGTHTGTASGWSLPMSLQRHTFNSWRESNDGNLRGRFSISGFEVVLPSVTVAAGASPAEGMPATFTLTRTEDTASEVDVPYTVTQTAGDMLPSGTTLPITGTASFAEDAETVEVSVATHDDLLDEDDATLMIELGAPGVGAGYTLGSDTTANITVTDNDDPPVVSIEQPTGAAASVVEGRTLSFTVRLDAASGKTVTVPYTLGGTSTSGATGDYTEPSPLSVLIAAGSTTATISIVTRDDSQDEPDETVEITLGDPPASEATLTTVTADQSATGTIQDNDDEPTVSIAATTGTVAEGGNLVFEVTVTPASGKAITVHYSVVGSSASLNPASSADFSDTATPAGILTISNNRPTGTITIATVDDDLDEEDEVLTVTLLDTSDLSNAVLADANLSADGTITDGDGEPEVSVAWSDTAPVAEGGSLEFTFTLTPVSAKEVRIPFTVAGGGANQAGTDDYTFPTASEVVFVPGDDTETVTIVTADDTEDEPDEGITVALGLSLTNAVPAANVASRLATGTIADNDAPEFTVADASATEGSAVEFTVTKSMASWQSITVRWAATTETGDTATEGADYASAASGTLTFAPTSTEETFEVATLQNTALDGSRTFTVTLSSVMPSGAATLSSSPTATGMIIDDDEPTFSVSVPDVIEGDSDTTTMTFTVTMSSVWNREVTVNYGITGGTATAGEDFLAQSSTGTLTYAPAGNGSPGVTEQTVEVEIVGDMTVELDETVTLSLSNVMGGAQISQADWTGTILSDDYELEGITVTPPSVNEPASGSASISFEVTLAGTWSRDVTVAYTLDGGTATLDADFTDATTRDDGALAAGQLVFPRGVTERTVSVAVTPDIVDEGDETVAVEIRKPLPAGTLLSIAGAQSRAARAEATIARPALSQGSAPPAVITVNPVRTQEVEGTTTSVFQISVPDAGRGFDVAFDWKVTRIRETGSGDLRTYTVQVLASSSSPARLAAGEDSASVEAPLSEAVDPGGRLGFEISDLDCGTGSCAVSQARAARDLATALSSGALPSDTVLAAVFQSRRFDERETRIQQHALAGFGRIMATGIVGGIWQRADAHRSSDVTSTARIGGRDIGTNAIASGDVARVARETARLFGVEVVQPLNAMAVDSGGFAEGTSGDLASWRDRTIVRDGANLLEGSRFSLVVGDDADGRPLGVWGGGSMSSYESESEDGGSVEGSAQVMLAGVDWRSGEYLAGVALSRFSGDSNYAVKGNGQSGNGTVEASLTGVTPYMHWMGATGLGIWGSFGTGSGTAELGDGDGAVETDVSMTILALGAKGASRKRGRYDYAIRGDLFRTSMTAEQTEGFEELAAEASRIRLALEGSTTRQTASGGAVSNRYELGARMDSGDGEDGAGADVAGEIRYASADGGLEMAGRVSLLLLHSQEGFSEWGAGLDVAYAPGWGGRGLRLSLEPRWNIPRTDAAESLWNGAVPGTNMDSTDAAEAGALLRMRLGYGMGAFGDLALASPYSEMETGSGERRLQFGVELRGASASLERFSVDLYGESEESDEDVEHRTMLEARLGF